MKKNNIRLSPIKAMELAASRIPGVISLAQGIPNFDTPEPIQEYVKEKISKGLCSRYSLTLGLPELREVIAEHLLRENMKYNPDNEIIVTCGSIEAISATLLALTSKDDKVLIPSPSYTSYQEAVKISGAIPQFFPLNEELNFDLEIEKIEENITPSTKAILYCNPNNPTGTIYSKEKSLKLANLAEKYNLFLIGDEVYKDFIYTDEPYFSLAQIPELKSRVIRVFSFSKAYSMTGWRVGFVHSDKEIIKEILKIHDSFVTCAPVASQYGAIAALEFAGDYIKKFKEEYKKRRDKTLEYLDNLSHIFDYQRPNSAYFVFPRVKDTVHLARDSTKLAYDILEKAKVALVPGIAFGPTGESHLRISFGRSMEHIKESFERLNLYFNKETQKKFVVLENPLAKKPKISLKRFLGIKYFSILAKIYLRRNKPEIIGITGNKGKTVVKRLLYEILSKQYNVRCNPRSYNTEIGLPLAILGFEIFNTYGLEPLKIAFKALFKTLFSKEKIDYLILEMGVRKNLDMQNLLKIIKPKFTVITKLIPEYSSDINYLKTLQHEMEYLRDKLPDAKFYVCYEDLFLKEVFKNKNRNVFFLSKDLFVRTNEQWEVKLDGKLFNVRREAVGESELYGILSALFLAKELNIKDEYIKEFISK